MTVPTPDSDPYALFAAWLAEAGAAEPNDPNAMCLATTTSDGFPTARMVLLKGLDARGFVFFTNHGSRKGEQLLANPRAALNFHWKSLRRVVRVEGAVEQVSAAESDEYYATRPRLSRIGAWASLQSSHLGGRAELEAAVAAAEARFPGADVPRPPHWGGFRVLPARIEFWRDMPFRLHDRRVFQAQPGGGWRSETLYP
jgi:pyridoxamine 5'-phosphate oxidase